jgi:tRNA-2-methylthio-N6-dimethylallyladenosine synthase
MRAGRRFFVETWGCQMNELDSQRLSGQLMGAGLVPTRDAADADLILLNSCSVREKAEQKVYSRLGEYRLFKGGRPGLKIGLCGCVAQEAGERALARVSDLDFVLGPARVGEIGAILDRIDAGERVVATGFPEEWSYDFDAVARDGHHKGMVTIIEGCNKNCTFCIVPTTRGAERCRPMEAILEEVRHLVDYGFLEIELLGQTVNHWRDPGAPERDFADLLEAVTAIRGVERLRFVTSYPRDFTDRMVEQVGRHPNICPYLHLPVQSGSDSVLRRMGRGYTVDEYARLVADLRRARPEIAISTDLIVGFPGETDEEFAATMRLVESQRFSSIFAFKYSPRPGTAAPRLGPPVDAAIADSRLQIVLARQQEIQRQLNGTLEGSVQEVLVTGPGRRPGTLTGRTICHRIVHFPAEPETALVGRLTSVRIERALPHSLLGTRVESAAGPA